MNPPLSNDQVSAKGLVVNGTVGYEYFFNPFIAIGAKGTFGYHYFFGPTAVVNSVEGHSSGYQVSALGTLTFHLGY